MATEDKDVILVETPGDIALDIASMAASAFPGLGGPISAFLSGIFVERKLKRMREVIHKLQENLEGFKSEVSEEYVKTEDFEELVEETMLRVHRERNEEKRLLYAQFLTGAIKRPSDPYAEKIRFLKIIDNIQLEHVMLLKAIRQAPDPNTNIDMGSPLQTLEKRLKMQRDMIVELVNDLNDMRITNMTGLKVMMTGHGAENLVHSITPLGQRLIRFIES